MRNLKGEHKKRRGDKEEYEGDKVENTRLKKAECEKIYGFQVATKQIAEGVAVSKLAAASGASFMDINVGCPIDEANRRGLGATFMDINVGCPIDEAKRRGLGAVMLRKPRSLAKMIHGIVLESELPVTVKIRTGESDGKINVERVVSLLAAAGAAAVTVHGRSMNARYKKPANWDLISQVASSDILTHYEAARRLSPDCGCHAAMIGRGALIKPWIFQEHKEGRELSLNAADRVGVYRRWCR
eukprot:gene12208-15337_t